MHGVDDGSVAVGVGEEGVSDPIIRRPFRLSTHRAGDPSLGQRAVRDATDALVGQKSEHLPFFLAVKEGVLVLHGHESGPSVQVSGVLQLGELPCPHRRGTEITDLPDLDEIVQRFHRFLDGRFRVEAVDLVQIDVISAEAGQGGIDLLHDRLAGQTALTGAIADLDENLCGDDDLVAVREPSKCLADDPLRAAERIDVRGVPEVDAMVERLSKIRQRFVLRQRPFLESALRVAKAHAAESNAADPEPRAAESCVFHGGPSFLS